MSKLFSWVGADDWFYKFFRLRSELSLQIDDDGLIIWDKHSDIFDIVSFAIKYLDFNKDIFFNEIISIFDVTNGGIAYSDLLHMPFDDYEKILDKCIQVQKQFKESIDKWNE